MKRPRLKKKKKTAKKTTEKIRWKKEHIVSKPPSADFQDKRAQARFLENPNLSQITMWSIFEHSFVDITRLLVDETNRYAHSEKNNLEFSVSMEEMMNFIGLVFMSGYNIRLSERDYWSTDPDLLCAASSKIMSRNRFFKIKSYLHAANTQMLKDSRMAKVAPLYNLLNVKLQSFGVVHEDLSIDESVVPYFGRHSCKQFIRAKPIRFSYKF